MSELRQNEKVKINESEGVEVLSLCAASMGHVHRKETWSQPGVLAAMAPRNLNFSTDLKSNLCSSKCAWARLIREEGGEGYDRGAAQIL